MCESGANDLVIRGPSGILEGVRDLLAGENTEIDFSRVLAPPPELTGKRRDCWCLMHWGTSANPRSTVLFDDRPDEGVVFYTFRTADGPPTGLLAHLAASHPQLDITLAFEADVINAGARYRWVGGRQISRPDPGRYLGCVTTPSRAERCQEKGRSYLPPMHRRRAYQRR
jgi:hypothetical protein